MGGYRHIDEPVVGRRRKDRRIELPKNRTPIHAGGEGGKPIGFGELAVTYLGEKPAVPDERDHAGRSGLVVVQQYAIGHHGQVLVRVERGRLPFELVDGEPFVVSLEYRYVGPGAGGKAARVVAGNAEVLLLGKDPHRELRALHPLGDELDGGIGGEVVRNDHLNRAVREL